jgi:hypothetical protein
MNLTPEERLIRDSYLAKSKIHHPISVEMMLLVVSIGAFIYGFFFSEDGQPMVFVAFCLSLIAAGRYIYSGRVYHPHITSLLQKYEDAIIEKNGKSEPHR